MDISANWTEIILIFTMGFLLALGLWYIALFFPKKTRHPRKWETLITQLPIPVIGKKKGKVFLSLGAREIISTISTQDISTLDGFLSLFSDQTVLTYHKAIAELISTKQSVSCPLDTKDGALHFLLRIDIWPKSSQTKSNINEDTDFIFWLQDINAQHTLRDALEKSEMRESLYSSILDDLPQPVWWRQQQDLDLIGVNQSYARLMGMAKENVLLAQTELGAGLISNDGKDLAQRALKYKSTQSESHVIALKGKRHILDFREKRLTSHLDFVMGYAEDLTSIDELQTQLSSYVAAHDDVLDNMRSAIAIFGPDRRLSYTNKAYQKLFSLDVDDLVVGMSYGAVMELLRSKRQLTEMVDFPQYKLDREALFTTLIERKEEMLHLPDGRTIQQYIIPHMQGGLVFLLEDVTDFLTLESSYNTQIAVQQATLNNLFEAVSVWGSDGRLKIWNRVFEEMWYAPPEELSGEPHVLTVFEKRLVNLIDMEAMDTPFKDRDIFLRHLVSDVTNRVIRHYDLVLNDDRVIHMSLIPLPNAQVLMIHWDITDTRNIEVALEERNAAFERADLLKYQFLSNISYEFRTPINAIQGFASLLKEEFYGTLNPRQKNHVQHILNAGDNLTQLVQDILDLAVIQAGLMDLSRREINLTEIISESILERKTSASEKNQTVNMKINQPFSYVGDGKQLTRALSNLLDAVFNHSKGQNVDVLLFNDEATYTIVYQTDWTDLLEEDREDLERRFVGIDPQALKTGVGLNVSVAKNLIAIHGGSIDIDVDAEQGFSLRVKLAFEQENP